MALLTRRGLYRDLENTISTRKLPVTLSFNFNILILVTSHQDI